MLGVEHHLLISPLCSQLSISGVKIRCLGWIRLRGLLLLLVILVE